MKSLDNDRPHLGNNIRAMRLLRNYTQAYMATQLNISKSRYSQIEHEKDINTALLYPIVRVLNIDMYNFLNLDLSQTFEKAIIPPKKEEI